MKGNNEKAATTSDTNGTPITPNQHYKGWPNAAGFDTREDVRNKIELPISGYFPNYVAGSLLRTGPGQSKVPLANSDEQFQLSHWFDGFTTVHKFDLIAGEEGRCKQVTYNSYSQVDGLVEDVSKTGKLDGITFGQKRDSSESLYKKLKTTLFPSGGVQANDEWKPDAVNVGSAFRPTLPIEADNTPHQGRRLMTLVTDGQSAKHFDADTLEPLGVTSQRHIHKDLTGSMSAARASYDPETGDLFNFNLTLGRTATYRVFRASPVTGEVEILATVSGYDIKGAYIHSLFLTENFVVLCIWPAYYRGGASMLRERNILDSIAPWSRRTEDPLARATWVVVDRRHGRGVVGKYRSPPFFCFHTVNAWEQPSVGDEGSVDLVCELFQYDNTDILHQYYYKNLVSNSPGAQNSPAERPLDHAGLARYKLNFVPLNGKVKLPDFPSQMPLAERIVYIPSPKSGDFPRINQNYALKPHRYVYGLIDSGKSSFADGLGKTDVYSETCVYWEKKKHTPGEPIFVPDPEGVAEDDGCILAVVFDGETTSSYLICLDARDMTEIGRVDVGSIVGFGFHGVHLGDRHKLY